MKIVEKFVANDGVEIQLEDWGKDCFPIGAYPEALSTAGLTKRGEKFRLTISENKYTKYSTEDVKADFESLKNGTKTIKDLSIHFWNGEQDKILLGMI